MATAEDRQIGELDAAVLVVRELAGSLLGDGSAGLDQAEARARYCHLLAARCELPELEARRLLLASWLSSLGDDHPVGLHLARQHGLAGDLHADSGSPEEQPMPGRLLNLVRAYQQLRSSTKEHVDPASIREHLQQACGTDETGRRIASQFARLLRDEAFLEGPRGGAGRVLVVDPAEIVTPVLEQPLRTAGFEVLTRGDGEAALQTLAETSVDLIVSEWKLPLLDGMAFCKKVKTDPRHLRVPFVFITSSRSRNVAARCLQAGADDVIKKPVDMQWLILRAQRLIQTAAPGGPEAPGPPAGGVTGSLTDMSLTDMVQIVGSGGRSMIIDLSRGGETAEVYVQHGDVIDARLGDAAGEQAFFQLMDWEEGTFCTRPFKPPPERTIRVSVTSLLMEGLRRRDERGEG